MPVHSHQPASLCDLSTTLPLLIGQLLDREARLAKGRFREETMTDIIAGALAAFAGPELVIQYPPEVVTGADLDLRFWNVAAGRKLKLRIQAKRLEAGFIGSKPVNIRCRSYRHLLYRPANSRAYQFRTLVNDAAKSGSVPLYMFYNHLSVAKDKYFDSAGPPVRGVNLAFATDIEEEMESKLQAAKQGSRKPYIRLSHLRKHMFGLESILCPDGLPDDSNVPTPLAVSNALEDRWKQMGEGYARTEENGASTFRILQLGALPGSPHGLADSSDSDRIRDGLPVRIDPTVERPRITFISGRTKDERTPTISDDYQE